VLATACATVPLSFEKRDADSWNETEERLIQEGATAIEWGPNRVPRLLLVDVVQVRELRKTTVETWQFRETAKGRSSERKIEKETRVETLDARTETRILGAWSGELMVSVAADDWTTQGGLEVVDGEFTNLKNLPFVPPAQIGAGLHMGTSSADLYAPDGYAELYRYMAARALAGVRADDEDSILRRSLERFLAPRRLSIQIESLELPELKTDPGGAKQARPEPFIHVLRGKDLLGCTGIVGKDLEAGSYSLNTGADVVAEFRPYDGLELVLYDEDLRTHDLLDQWRGPAVSGALGAVQIRVEAAPEAELFAPNLCENRAFEGRELKVDQAELKAPFYRLPNPNLVDILERCAAEEAADDVGAVVAQLRGWDDKADWGRVAVELDLLSMVDGVSPAASLDRKGMSENLLFWLSATYPQAVRSGSGQAFAECVAQRL